MLAVLLLCGLPHPPTIFSLIIQWLLVDLRKPLHIKNPGPALAGVAQTECQPVKQRVTGSIPSQDTCLGCRPGPQ